MSSGVPKELNENWGRNWGLDGFWHDMDYGHDAHVNVSPGSGALSGLPGDIVSSDLEEEGDAFSFEKNDLGDMGVVAALGAPLMPSEGVVDHHWLSDAQQDPARLPKIQDSLTQLQILWGDRTDGFFRVPAVDRIEDVVRREETRNEEKVNKLASTVQRIVRAYTAGKSDEELIPEIGEAAWAEASPWVKEAAEDRGLLGNVYVFAGSYPGLSRGPWADAFAKVVKRASYLVVPHTVTAKTQARLAEMFGVQVVTSPDEIPWQEELQARTGKTASTPAKARRLLANHFLAEPVRIRPFDGQRTVVKAQEISTEEAQKAFAAHRPNRLRVASIEEREEAAQRKSVGAYMQRWVRGGLLDARVANRLLALKPAEALQKAATIVARKGLVRQGTYEGVKTTSSEVSEAAAWKAVEAARKLQEDAHIARWQAKVKASAAEDFRSRRDALEKMVKARWISRQAMDRFMASPKPTRDVLDEAEAMAAVPKEAASFSGRHSLPQIEVTEADVEASLGKAQHEREAQSLRVRRFKAARALEAKVKRLSYILDQGTVGESFAREVRASFSRQEAKEAWPFLQPLLKRAQELTQRSETPEFKGPVVHGHSASVRPQRDPVTLPEIQHHLAEAMHQGLTGRQLTASLLSKVAVDDLRPHAQAIRAFRADHEGKMGLTYVDAAHYASRRGMKGCEEGAARMHPPTVSGVLGMDACRTCVAYDGSHNRCMTYQKPMLWDVPEKSLLPRQRREVVSTSNPVIDFGLHDAMVVQSEEKAVDAVPDVAFGLGMKL